MPARNFVVLYAALELTLGVTGSQEGVANFAHLGAGWCTVLGGVARAPGAVVADNPA